MTPETLFFYVFSAEYSLVLVTKLMEGEHFGASIGPVVAQCIPKDWWHKALLLSGLVDARCMARKFLLGLPFFAIVSRIFV